jgi:hypothetical protein
MTRWRPPAVAPGDDAGWERRLRGLHAGFRDFAATARQVAASTHAAAQRRWDRERERADREAAAERDRIGQVLAEALRSAGATAARRAAELAGGLAGVDYGGPQWQSVEFLGTAVPQHVRVGTLVAPSLPTGAPVPVVVPLASTAGWAVEAEPEPAAALVRGTVLRLVAAAPPFQVRVDSYDPQLTGVLGAFGGLHSHTADIVAESMTRAEPLAGCLAELADLTVRRGARLAERGYRGFDELLAAGEADFEPYRLLVLLDYPAGIDVALQREILRVAGSAAARGVCLLVHHNRAVAAETDVDPIELLDRLRRFTARHDRWEIAGFDRVACRRDPDPDRELCATVSLAIGRAARRAALPTVELAGLLPPTGDRLGRVGTGKAAELRVDIGATGRSAATVRLRTYDPPLPHILVGGAVGQGKSNLLHVLVHGLAARYTPDDLQMYLLDFKQGLEFSVLGPGPGRPHWLPHARVLGVHADREFGLAVLRHVEAELVERGALFKRLGNVDDIAALPAGNPLRPPRLLLVLDEFQVLLAADDELAEESTALLERLIRLGRAYGLHVVLATQTLEGIQRLATKRDSIFGQVPYRIVLKTTPSDSQTMLQLHNRAAAGLRFRGQAILNDNFGSPDANQQVLVAHADQRELDRLRRELWQRAATRPPRIFELDAAADLPAALAARRDRLTSDGEAVPAWLGLPVSVDERPASIEIRPEPGAGLLLLGDDAPAALGVLGGVAVSLAHAAAGRGDAFVVLDLLPDDPELTRGRDTLLAALRELGAPVTLAERSQVPGQIYQLRDAVRGRGGGEPPVHVLAVGMHRAVRLSTATGDRWDSPADALQELAKDGAGVGVFVYGWWNRLKACRDQLGYDPPIGTYLFLRHPVDGVKEVCGSFVRWEGRRWRGLLYDGLSAEPRQLVTFQPLRPADLPAVAGRAP